MLMSMSAETKSATTTTWQNNREARDARIAAGARLAHGKIVEARDATALLEAVIRPGDRVCLEGDNQKQADLLGAAPCWRSISPRCNDLHMVQSGVVLPEHLDLFDRGVAKRLDYAYSGPQSARIARMLFGGKIELGAVHTYLELFARYFIDLTPQRRADRRGQRRPRRQSLHRPEHRGHADRRRGDRVQGRHRRSPRSTRSSTRCRASTSRGTGSHFVVKADKPFFVEPLFTRDPAADHRNARS